MRQGENEESNKTWKIIGGVIFLVWFIGSMIGIPIVQQTAVTPGPMLILAGQFFLGFTIILLVGVIKGIRRHHLRYEQVILTYVFALASGGVMGSGILIMNGTFEETVSRLPEWICGHAVENIGTFYAKLFLGVFAILAGSVLIGAVISRLVRKRHCVESVPGMCMGVRSRWNRDQSPESSNILIYAPVFQYEYKNCVYEECEEIYVSTNPVREGQSVTLYINPQRPQEFYMEGIGLFHRELFLAGIIMTVLPIVVIFIL